jgi:hypothetical protein
MATSGTGAVAIGCTGGSLTLKGSSVDINSTGAAVTNINTIYGVGNVNVGNTASSFTVNSVNSFIGNTGFGSIIMQAPITFKTALTLGSRPTATTHLGGTTTITDNGTTNHNGTTPVTMSTIPIPSAGTWLLTGSVFTGATTTVICFSPTINTFSLPGAMTSPANSYTSISFVVSTAGATNYYFVSNTTTTGTSMTYVYTYLTRLG